MAITFVRERLEFHTLPLGVSAEGIRFRISREPLSVKKDTSKFLKSLRANEISEFREPERKEGDT